MPLEENDQNTAQGVSDNKGSLSSEAARQNSFPGEANKVNMDKKPVAPSLINASKSATSTPSRSAGKSVPSPVEPSKFTKIPSVMSKAMNNPFGMGKIAYKRNTGIVDSDDVDYTNSDDIELISKFSELSASEYNDLEKTSEVLDIYSYIEKVAGIPRSVAKAVDKKEAFSGEYLKDMDYNVPEGYEVKGDLVCPIEKEAEYPTISPGSMQINNNLLNMPTSIGGQERDWGGIVRDVTPSATSVAAGMFSGLTGSSVSKNLNALPASLRNKAIKGTGTISYAPSEISARNRASNDTLGKTIDRIGGIGAAMSVVPHPVTRIAGTAINTTANAVNFGRDLNQSLQQHPFGQTMVGSIKQPPSSVNLNAPQPAPQPAQFKASPSIDFKSIALQKAAHELKSTNIKSVDYNKENKSLDVEFHSGGTYTYKNVPKSLFDRIKRVKSPGKFFHKHIKKKEDVYPYNKIEKKLLL